MPSDAVIKLRLLRIRQRCGVRFQALPHRVEQFCLLRGGEAVDLASQIAYNPSAVFPVMQARSLRGMGLWNPTSRKGSQNWGTRPS
jgi:hypothetical protein